MYITGIQAGYPKMSRDPRQDQEKRGSRQKTSPSEAKDEVQISEAAQKLLAQIAKEDNRQNDSVSGHPERERALDRLTG